MVTSVCATGFKYSRRHVAAKLNLAFQPLLSVFLGILTIIVERRPASRRASIRAAKEGFMEGSRMVSKWFFDGCPMCSIGFLWFSCVPSLWFSFCVPLFCLLFANVSLFCSKVFLLCILFSYEFHMVALRTCILYGLSRRTDCNPLTSSPPALQSRACRAMPAEPCL